LIHYSKYAKNLRTLAKRGFIFLRFLRYFGSVPDLEEFNGWSGLALHRALSTRCPCPNSDLGQPHGRDHLGKCCPYGAVSYMYATASISIFIPFGRREISMVDLAGGSVLKYWL
jgi:hypothetical protein